MKRRIRQVFTVLGALLVTFAVLWSGELLLRRVAVAQPLEHLLKTDRHVKSFHINHPTGSYEIKVTFFPSGDLKQEYLGLQREVSDLVGPDAFTLQVVEPTAPALVSLEEQFDLAVQEGIWTGHFTAMNQQLQSMAGKAGGRVHVTADGNNVYLSYAKKGQFLEQVVSRAVGGSQVTTPP